MKTLPTNHFELTGSDLYLKASLSWVSRKKQYGYIVDLVHSLSAKSRFLTQRLLALCRPRDQISSEVDVSKPCSLESPIFLLMTRTFNRLVNPHLKKRRMPIIPSKTLQKIFRTISCGVLNNCSIVWEIILPFTK